MLLLSSCATGAYVSSDDFLNGRLKENMKYEINSIVDLKGTTVAIPSNCTIQFKKGGLITNGNIIGTNTVINYEAPFVGSSASIQGCKIEGRKVIKDKDVFVTVRHTQSEIQTLFDISGGKRLVFSTGEYHNVDRIQINGNIEADFNKSTIRLLKDSISIGNCFYMEPWVDNDIDYVKIKNLNIEGKRRGLTGATKSRRCIQLFHVSNVVLDNVNIDGFYGGPDELKKDGSDLVDKTRIGTSAIAIIMYDKCNISNCNINDISKEIFWCVPNNNGNNLTVFINNKSNCTSENGSASFLTLLDGRCVVKDNEVYNYNSSAFNLFCYDSEIANNKFYNGKRSIAIDLSEGTMYKSRNVYVHDNECFNSKGLLRAYGEQLRIINNRWTNTKPNTGKQFAIISIITRGERTSDEVYIGNENNSTQYIGTFDIVVDGNIFVNRSLGDEAEIRGALLYGDDVIFSNNVLEGLNMPVVQFVEGEKFIYQKNIINKSKKGKYPELLVNNGVDVTVSNNKFYQNISNGRNNCTVQLLKAEGSLIYKGNMVQKESTSYDQLIYVPCFIMDYNRLESAEIYVEGMNSDIRMETGLPSSLFRLKTNINR